MIVFKLTKELTAKAGVYNNIWEFAPLKDANGNDVCGLADGENDNYPFVEELKQCPQIEYVPIPPPIIQ